MGECHGLSGIVGYFVILQSEFEIVRNGSAREGCEKKKILL